MRKNPAAPQASRQGDRLFLRVCLFSTGACALVLEILGTRLISPYYGSSLYTWSALITVTLVSLAAGYNWGGRLADRTPVLTLAARLLSCAALAVSLAPVLRAEVLHATSRLGIQLGALTAGLMLVAPALVLLSALGPLAVRLTAEELATVGRSAGDVYAVSTLGSVAGAILAGFVLIPHLPLAQILYGMAALLFALAGWAQFLSQRRLPLAQPAMAAAVALFGFWPRAAADTNIVLNKESAYGQIKVLDFGDNRYLLVNGTTQSMMKRSTMRSESQYAQSMELAAILRPRARNALVIGLGAGTMTSTLEREYPLTVDTAEIDPDVIAAAKSFFGFAPKGLVLAADGRALLERGGPTYDLIFLDAFGSELPPFHLFTTEAFSAMRRRLAADGILAINIVSLIHGTGGKAWRSAYKTLEAVFPHVRAYQASDASEDLGNVVFFCSAEPLAAAPPAAALRPGVRANLAAMLARPLTAEEGDGIVMTDDFAPMESLLAETSLLWRRSLQKKVESVLLY